MSNRTRNKVSYNVTFWSQMKKNLGSLKMTTTVIVALIPNIMTMITLFQLQLTFPSLELTSVLSEWNLLYRKRDQNLKKNISFIMSLATSFNETNYDAFDPPIPEECLESNIDKTPHKWTASTVSSGRCNASNIIPLHPRPQKRVHNKKEPIYIWTNFFIR